MIRIAVVLTVVLTGAVAVADSLVLRLDGVAGRTQETAYAFSGDWEAWAFDLTGTPTYRLGYHVADLGTCPVKLLARYAERDDSWGVQIEVGVAKDFGYARLSGCFGATLPVLGQTTCLYSPGLSLSWSAGGRVRVGAAATYSWPGGGDFTWNAGPEVGVRLSENVSINYRNTFLGNGAQEDQLKCVIGW